MLSQLSQDHGFWGRIMHSIEKGSVTQEDFSRADQPSHFLFLHGWLKTPQIRTLSRISVRLSIWPSPLNQTALF